MNQQWHSLPFGEVLRILNSRQEGLSEQDIEKRQTAHGLNVIPDKKRKSPLVIFVSQFNNILMYILLAAAAISFFLKDFIEAIVILIAAILNIIVGFVQEYKAENALYTLHSVLKSTCRVKRGGVYKEINAQELTIGDIVALRLGDRISADGRIIRADDLEINESSLTGESMPVAKSIDPIERGKTVPDRVNMAYKSAIVSRGTGEFIVTAIGLDTEIGKIARQISNHTDESTPLQKVLTRFSKGMGILVLVLALLIFAFGVITGREIFDMFQVAVALAVAAVPEGLVIAVTAVLAIGMQRLLHYHGLVRNLLAAETLGSTTVICVDKTGTITEGEMRLVRVIVPDANGSAHHHFKDLKEKDNRLKRDEQVFEILRGAALISDATIEKIEENGKKVWKAFGGSTEKAITLAAFSLGVDKTELEKEFTRLDTLPFNSRSKYSAVINKSAVRQNTLYVMGAPEIILSLCSSVRRDMRDYALSNADNKKFEKEFESLIQSGLRMTAVAIKELSENEKQFEGRETGLMNNLTFIGFLAFRDPVRSQVKDAMQLCQAAGIRVIMITGDHRLTAKAIAGEVGLNVSDKEIIQGTELPEMSDDELRKRVNSAAVFARTLPMDKLRIVNALKANGEVVAMTGDGVNDAPALMKADIGVALGSGTDAAKDSADLVLLDNNFLTIVRAVEQGRVIFDNIRKITLYLLSDCFAQAGIIAAALLYGLPLPMTAVQILWINLVTDSLPAIALTAEYAEADELMKEKPRETSRPILDRKRKFLIGFISLIIALAGLILFNYVFDKTSDLAKSQTMIFALVGIITLFLVLSVRTLRHTILSPQIFRNPYLVLSVIIGFFLLILPIYVPFLQRFFGTVALNASDWTIIAGISAAAILAVEIIKLFFRWRMFVFNHENGKK